MEMSNQIIRVIGIVVTTYHAHGPAQAGTACLPGVIRVKKIKRDINEFSQQAGKFYPTAH
jgi:hypothetical protein